MSQASRFLGRFRSTDAGRTINKTADLAEKVEIARFDGPHFTAEREGDALVIYCIGDDTGVSGVNVITKTGDRAPRTTADLQAVYDKAYSRPETPRQRLDREAGGRALADRVRTLIR